MASDSVTVVRLAHRPGRDERVTTHVALTARALGADAVVLPATATAAIETARDVTDRFGGPFEVRVSDQPEHVLAEWAGSVVHLTMYGQPIQQHVDTIATETDGSLAIAIGAGKVSPSVYELADWNIAVTNQPHSEIAALAVFLDRYLDDALSSSFEGATQVVEPHPNGKRLRDADGEETG